MSPTRTRGGRATCGIHRPADWSVPILGTHQSGCGSFGFVPTPAMGSIQRANLWDTRRRAKSNPSFTMVDNALNILTPTGINRPTAFLTTIPLLLSSRLDPSLRDQSTDLSAHATIVSPFKSQHHSNRSTTDPHETIGFPIESSLRFQMGSPSM
jgi:hypothetical protein